jgi:hypothetical protein
MEDIEELLRSMTAKSQLWKGLETEFIACPDPFHELRANWQYTVGSDEIGRWQLAGATNRHLYMRFEALGRTAGALLFKCVLLDPLTCWLELIRVQGINFRTDQCGYETNADGSRGKEYLFGSIDRVCEASATMAFLLCQAEQIDELTPDLSGREDVADPFPVEAPHEDVTHNQASSTEALLVRPAKAELKKKRERIIAAFRKERDLTVDDLARRVGRSKTAIYGMINGDATRYDTAAVKDFLEKICTRVEDWVSL